MALTETREQRASTGRSRWWRWVALLEVLLVVATVALDLLIPSLVVLALMVVSLLARRDGLGTLGMVRLPSTGRTVAEVLGLSVLWTLLTIGLTMPLLEHLTGEQQDLSGFDELEGNLPLLLVLVAASWTLAAFCEELAMRGYVQTRMRQVLPAGTTGLVVAVLLSSVLFGFLHTEQGLIGVILVTIDGVWFSVLRYHYRSLWAAVLAHGFNNTIGMTAFFLVGPFYGLW